LTFVETTLQSLPDAYPPPTASIYFGAAGAAIGLLSIARARGDAALLELADKWCSRAVALIGTRNAYDDGDEVPRELIGRVTPYHTESGIHAAAAMIAAARGDTLAQRRAVEAFLRASRRRCAELDLTLGRSGSLLAAAMLLAIFRGGQALMPVPASHEQGQARVPVLHGESALRTFGSETMNAIWDARPNPKYTGMAHGWAGYLYAALRWCEASGDALPPRLIERLRKFAAKKVLHGRGAYWPTVLGKEHHPIPGWCNGSAGQLFLFTLAHRLLGDDEWLRLAELCAWNTWDENRRRTSLCCGSAGRAYALLNLYRHTGEAAWLKRARQLANHAAAGAATASQHAHSLWQGELGVAVLLADLASPENARMPFFE
jgi:serine/threonine-protein kinase